MSNIQKIFVSLCVVGLIVQGIFNMSVLNLDVTTAFYRNNFGADCLLAIVVVKFFFIPFVQACGKRLDKVIDLLYLNY